MWATGILGRVFMPPGCHISCCRRRSTLASTLHKAKQCLPTAAQLDGLLIVCLPVNTCSMVLMSSSAWTRQSCNACLGFLDKEHLLST